MKIIDLLNKIANGESVPLKIKYDKVIWNYDKDSNDYYSDEWLFSGYLGNSMLNEFCNDEAKIIEEEKKIELPEELKEILIPSSLSDSDDFRFIFNYINDLIKNQKQIVDYLKYKEEESKK